MITWLTEPLPKPKLDRLHSIFELRERRTHRLLSDHFSFHLLQLPELPLSPSRATGYAAQVERWARFLCAPDEAALDRLAAEDPIMHLATQTLDELSQDPETRRLARDRADELQLYQIDLASSREEGRREGLAEVLLLQLGQRFGRPPAAIRARVRAARPKQLETWLGRVLKARSLDQIFAR